jgi:hypothetical protein
MHSLRLKLTRSSSTRITGYFYRKTVQQQITPPIRAGIQGHLLSVLPDENAFPH